MRGNFDWYVGVDEVGRGPIAGPLTVGAVCFNREHPRELIGVRDSKVLSSEMREKWLGLLKSTECSFTTASVSNQVIDRKGLSYSIRLAIARALRTLELESNQTLILLDGGLRAPDCYLHQETIIRGDQSEPLIAAASIVAKVHRDKKMINLSKRFPQYFFERHKGYGTKLHYQAIDEHSISAFHRRTFLPDHLARI